MDYINLIITTISYFLLLDALYFGFVVWLISIIGIFMIGWKSYLNRSGPLAVLCLFLIWTTPHTLDKIKERSENTYKGKTPNRKKKKILAISLFIILVCCWSVAFVLQYMDHEYIKYINDIKYLKLYFYG